MKKRPPFIVVAMWLILQSCATVRTIPAEVQYRNYPVTNQTQDTALLRMIAPYKDSVRKTMNIAIGFANESITKNNNSPLMGNFFTDAMREMAGERFKRKVDAAIMNSGGIRSYIPKGEITIGKVYEIMPFDNLLVLQETSGVILKQLLDHAASKGGWPVSGITFEIKDRKAANIMINGEPLNESKVYTIVQSDYVASGGDNSEMVKHIPQINSGYVLRDALIAYIRKFTDNGKPVTASPEKRIANADQP